MTSPFSQHRCRKVRQNGYGANRRIAWVPGADFGTQMEVLCRREHALRVWSAIHAVLAVAGAVESTNLIRDGFCDDAAAIDEAAGWRYWRYRCP